MSAVTLYRRDFPGRVPPLVALHGFTLTGEMFAELAAVMDRSIVAPDLPGHGRSRTVAATLDATIEGVAGVLEAIAEPRCLLGYSMGGRLALATALERPHLVDRLVLISASPGIEDDAARAQRVEEDEALAARIGEVGVAGFLAAWTVSPMFAGLARRGPAWLDADHRARLENDAAGLAAALRGLGQGVVPWMGDRLGEIGVPVLVVAGERDLRYADLARRMAAGMPHGRPTLIPGCGHAVVGEAPQELGRAVSAFLDG